MPRKTAAAPVAEPEDLTPASAPFDDLVPLSWLYLHPLNPRLEPPEAEIEALAASIAAVGLLQNLSGFADHQIRFRAGHDAANPDHIGIVAGGRRLRALQLLAQRGQWDGLVPVHITTDADLASQWAGAENETQRGLSIPDRITAYAQMRAKGHGHEAIAAAFATPISDVRRLLALAALPAPALDALRADKISFTFAKHLTTARDAATQDRALAVALSDKGEYAARDILQGGTVRANDRRALFVGLAAYQAAGGTTTEDLFADHAILHDPALLDELAQAKGIEATEDLRQAEGWAWAQFLPTNSWQFTENLRRIYGERQPLPDGDAERMAHLESLPADQMSDSDRAELETLQQRSQQRHFTDADRASAGIVTTIGNGGSLSVERAYLRKGDRAATSADDDSIDMGPAPAEAAMPQNLKDDLRRIRLIVLQDALRRDEVLCHDLLALQLARKLPAWQQPFALDQTHATPPSKPDGTTIPAELAAPAEADHASDPAEVVAKWVMPSNELNSHAAMFNGLARAFCRWDGPVVDLIVTRAAASGRPINARSLWAPTLAGFLTRVSVGYLDTLWRDLVPDEGSRHAGFASLPKKEKARELDRLFSDWSYREAMGLSRDTNTRIDTWLPEDLRFSAANEGDE